MKDTPDFILQKQFDIIYKKTNLEKLQITTSLMQLSFDMAYNLIKRQNPTFSDREIVAKRFEMMYNKEFSEEEMKRITAFLLQEITNNLL